MKAEDQPVYRNDSVKLELLGAWETTCSECPLLDSEGKSSQSFVFDGDKTICG